MVWPTPPVELALLGDPEILAELELPEKPPCGASRGDQIANAIEVVGAAKLANDAGQ
jgi:hypothetical protein